MKGLNILYTIKKINKYHYLSLVLALFAITSMLMSQQPEGVDVGIRPIVTGDSVHVYHNGPFMVGRGFNIYRQDPGETEFQQINEEPVYGIEYASQLSTV